MNPLENQPFAYFLRLYAAHVDGENRSTPPTSRDDFFRSIFTRYRRSDLQELLAQIQTVIAKHDEDAARALFNDGHFYNVWHSSTAAQESLGQISAAIAGVLKSRSHY